ncbi:MAG: hypothetical protein TR69_WS6001000523 [candidate division WS6 bacterium OLB20]|uniref:ACR n=1 Tax=candidate division WS6 bacterium OLB20 TaxID=1617426 RepID=A0A136LXZ0_9BACT|nr:MAG: hypothetical protein TR69_WS6001000523 [candidate division WS6 bacterium OLB20]
MNERGKQLLFGTIVLAVPLVSVCSLAALQTVSDTRYISPAVVPQPEERITVTFPDSGYSVSAEIADTTSERSTGLMFRQTLPEGTGMLFVFPDERPRSFWMRNTYVPLDIIFISAEKRIVRIHENATPLQEQPTYDSGLAAQYVLEVPAGTSASHSIRTGDVISF